MAMDKKGGPGLMIAVLDGLKKKGKMEDSMPSSGNKEEDESKDYRAYLEDIAKDFLQAIEDKDHIALADLLEEAFDCLDSQPHYEGPHEEEEETAGKYPRR